MSFALVYLVCSLADPMLCEEHALRSPGQAHCVHSAQAEIAGEIRPGWRLAGWRCGPERPTARDRHAAAARPAPQSR